MDKQDEIDVLVVDNASVREQQCAKLQKVFVFTINNQLGNNPLIKASSVINTYMLLNIWY